MEMDMAHIICIANQKGGVGKTTTAINLSAALADLHQKTLLIDSDPQANATIGMGISNIRPEQSLYYGLIGQTSIHHLMRKTYMDTLSIIPSHTDLTGFEVEMMNQEDRELALKNLIQPIKDRFDFVIIDCPPSLSLLTVNAMTAADSILIPLQCEFFALDGLRQLLQTIQRIKESLNQNLSIAGILLTMYDQRTNLSRQVLDNAKQYFENEGWVFNTVIPRSVRFGEAPGFGLTIFQHDMTSLGAKSYIQLAKELLERQRYAKHN